MTATMAPKETGVYQALREPRASLDKEVTMAARACQGSAEWLGLKGSRVCKVPGGPLVPRVAMETLDHPVPRVSLALQDPRDLLASKGSLERQDPQDGACLDLLDPWDCPAPPALRALWVLRGRQVCRDKWGRQGSQEPLVVTVSVEKMENEEPPACRDPQACPALLDLKESLDPWAPLGRL